MFGVGGARGLVHALPGRRYQQARQIGSDESRAARLPRRNPQAAQMLASRTIDIDAAAAPARVPDQAIGVDHRAIEPANAAMLQQHLGVPRGSPVAGSSATRQSSFFAVSAK